MKEVQLLATLLDKAVRQYSLYGGDHPQTQGALKDFHARMHAFVNEAGSLKIEVKRTELDYEGHPVFKLEKRDNNYVQEAYVDGIREIEFMPGILLEELKNMVSVLARDVRTYEVREDDTVTLFWKRGFQSIRFKTVDVYAQDLNALLREIIAEEELLDAQGEEKNYLDQFIERLLAGEGRKSMATMPRDSLSATHKEYVGKPIQLGEIDFGSDERQQLRKEATTLGERDYLPELATLFAEVLESESKVESLCLLLRAYLSQVKGFLISGNLRKAFDWLRRLRSVQLHLAEQSLELQAAVDGEINSMMGDEVIEALGTRISAGLSATPEDWMDLLKYLGSASAETVCRLLPFFTQETLHNLFVDYLVQHAPNQRELYVRFLSHSNPKVVRGMIRVLSKVAQGKGLAHLFIRVAVHPDPLVRAEVVRAAGSIPNQDHVPLLIRGMKDSAEAVRDETLRSILRSPFRQLYAPLAEQIASDDFSARQFSEKKQFLVALARCGGESSMGLLQKILDPSGSMPEELQMAALYGVSELSGALATQLLEASAKDGGKFRELALQLLTKQMDAKRETHHDR